MKKMVFTVTTDFEQRLPFYAEGVGISYDQENITRPNGYPYYQWIQTRRGAGRLVTEGREFLVGEGQGMLLFPNIPHEYRKIGEVWDVDWIIFKGRSVADFFLHSASLTRQGVYDVSHGGNIAVTIERIYENERSSRAARNIETSRLTYGVLTDLLRLCFSSAKSSMEERYMRLRPLFELIEENFASDISLAQMASVMEVTPQHLCVLFKSVMGLTLSEYINSVRIQKSKQLLLSDLSLPIKAVAPACGFGDVSYFCSVFRRGEGVTPSRFRKLHM